MSINSEIARIKANIASAYAAAGTKGAELPEVENSENLAATIGMIPDGTVDFSAANAHSYEIAKGRAAYLKDGLTVGTAPIVFTQYYAVENASSGITTWMFFGLNHLLMLESEDGLFFVNGLDDLSENTYLVVYLDDSGRYIMVKAGQILSPVGSSPGIATIEFESNMTTFTGYYIGTRYL